MATAKEMIQGEVKEIYGALERVLDLLRELDEKEERATVPAKSIASLWKRENPAPKPVKKKRSGPSVVTSRDGPGNPY